MYCGSFQGTGSFQSIYFRLILKLSTTEVSNFPAMASHDIIDWKTTSKKQHFTSGDSPDTLPDLRRVMILFSPPLGSSLGCDSCIHLMIFFSPPFGSSLECDSCIHVMILFSPPFGSSLGWFLYTCDDLVLFSFWVIFGVWFLYTWDYLVLSNFCAIFGVWFQYTCDDLVLSSFWVIFGVWFLYTCDDLVLSSFWVISWGVIPVEMW